MSAYSLSGSGTQPLSAGVTALHVAITTLPAGMTHGNATPTNHFHIGLLRFGDGTAYYAPIPIVGGPEWFGVPIGTTIIGYALLNGAVVSVEELIGGTTPLPTISVNAPTDYSPNNLSPLSWKSIGVEITAIAGTFSPSGAYPAANLSIFVPLRITEPFICASAFIVTGSTVAGHWDVGVYDDTFNLLAHTGSVTEAGTVSLQSAALSVTLQVGKYWLAIAADSTSLFTAVFNMSSPARFRLVGARTSTSNFPLATLPTLSTPSTSFIPAFGISRYTP